MPETFKTSSNRLSRHVEISEMLAREIQAGILLDGSRLAPERQMAEKLGVAVGTLRKALLDLTEKGLLERVHGSGNYVRSRGTTKEAQANTIYSFFRLELIAGGGLPTAEVVSVDKLVKPDDIGDIGPDDFGHRIRRLRRLNGIDAALEEIWIDGNKREIIRKEELSDSLYLFYKEELGHWITNAHDNVSILQTPEWKPDDFGSKNSDNSQVWGYIERFSFDQNNQCVEFSKTWFDPQTTRFVARWK
ncbi:MAG: GntR family transcriptional regulator [Rhizobiales bacterium]|nr:GntR family transcriptional regulator [Hyphomicrobiales bacterium]NRB13339.1 GntR family transcriptional regulator [Hyphomicrobiales bacterium]